MNLNNSSKRGRAPYRKTVLFGLLLGVNVLILSQWLTTDPNYSQEHLSVSIPNNVIIKPMKSVTEDKPQPVRIQIQKSERSAPQAKSTTVHVSAADATKTGEALLRAGNIPALEGRYELPFSEYWSLAERLGARLAVFDRQTNRVVGIIKGGQFQSEIAMNDYARRARDVSEDIPTEMRREYLAKAKTGHGGGAYRLLVLFPKHMEVRFFGVLAEALRSEGVLMETLDRVAFSYTKVAGKVFVEIQEVERQGKIIPIKVSTNLWP